MSETNEYSGAVESFLKTPDAPNDNAQAGLAIAAGTNPDYEAELRKLSASTGVPLESARSNIDEVKKQAFLAEANPSLLQSQYGKVSQFLANPDNAAVSHDDIDVMKRMSDLWGSFTNGVERGSLQDQVAPFHYKALLGTISAEEEKQRKALSTKLNDVGQLSANDAGLAYWLGQTGYSGRQMVSSLREGGKGALYGASAGVAMAAIAGQMGPQVALPEEVVTLPAGALIGGRIGYVGSSLIYNYKQEAGFAYDEFTGYKTRDGNSLDVPTAKAAAVAVGLINAGLETTGEIAMAKLFPGVGNMLSQGGKSVIKSLLERETFRSALAQAGKKWVRAATTEGITESIQELSTIIGGELAKKGDGGNFDSISLNDAAQRTWEAGRDAFAGSLGVGAGPSVYNAVSSVRSAQAAQHTQDFMVSLGETATDSKLLQRMPDKFRELVQKIKEGGPVDNVYIPAEQFAKYWQEAGVNPADVATEIGARNYTEAMATGGDVVIPIEDYATHIAPTQHHAALMQDARLHLGDMTPRELAAFEADREQRMKDLADEFDNAGEDTAKDSYKTIFDSIMGELTGRFDRGTAEAYATLYAKGMTVLANRAGVDPMALHERYGMTVKSVLPEVVQRFGNSDISIDPYLDRLRAGDIPTNEQIYGPRLADFVRSRGGLIDFGGNVSVMDPDAERKPFQRNIINNKDGRSIDEMREAAAEAGFTLPENSTEADLLDLLDQDLRGEGVYRWNNADQKMLDTKIMLEGLDKALREYGIDINSMTNEQVRAAMDEAAKAIGENFDAENFNQQSFTPASAEAIRNEVQWTEIGEQNGFPTWKNDKIALSNPRDVTEEADSFYVPVEGRKVVKYDIQNTTGENVGYVVVEIEDGWPTMLINIEATKKGEHYGEQAIAGILSDVGELTIFNIDPKARSFWEERLGTHTDGVFGTLTFDAYAYARAERENAGSVQEGVRLNQPAYHGSPYKFDKFSLEHMGRGEGAQAYGWGLYFAGSKEVGEFYRKGLSDIEIRVGGQEMDANNPEHVAAQAIFEAEKNGQTKQDAIERYRKSAEGLLQRGKQWATELANVQNAAADLIESGADIPKYEEVSKGQLYKVDIPEDDTMLLWDKPLSEQPEKVRVELAPMLQEEVDRRNANRERMNASNPSRLTHPVIGKLANKVSTVDDIKGSDAYETISKQQGGDEAASKLLNSLGISGIKYLDGQSRSSGEGNYNYVVFDDKAINVLQTYYQPAQGDNRGYIRFGDDRKFEIGLLEKSDLSTFLHETGHFFIEVVGDLAQGENAAQGVKDDYATLLKWFGVDNRDGIKVEHHEQFARGFEAYLMEGKAPSPELRGVFQRFKAWLTLIYRRLANLDVRLNNDVRSVMDRMLATDEEIEAAKRDVGMSPIFATAQDAGMSDVEFSAYSKLIADESESAKEELQNRLMSEYDRAQKIWWKVEKDKVRKEVEEETNALPVYRAFDALVSGKTPEGVEIKLNKADLVDRYGAEYVKRIPRGFQRLYSAEGGMATDLAAEVLGYSSADELVESLVNMRPRREVVEGETEARMRQRYGDTMQDGTIHDKALAAVHNNNRASVIAVELRALKRKQREVQPVLNTLNRDDAQQRSAMMDSIPPVDAFRDIARGQIGQKLVRDLNPNLYLNGERKASKEAFKAAASGDYQVAAMAKQRELLNHFMYREAMKAVDEIESVRKYATDLQKTAAQQRIGKAGASYLEQINNLLERYEFKRVSNTQLDRRQSLQNWYNAQVEAGFNPAIDPKLLETSGNVNYREVPVDELRALGDALKSIEFLARKKNQLLGKNAKVEFRAAIDELVASARANTKAISPKSIDPALRIGKDRVVDWFRSWDADLLPVETIVEWLDGGKADGPWHRYLFNLASDAQTAELDIMGKMGDKIGKLLDDFHMNDKTYLLDKFKFDGVGTVSRHWLISVALNCGNESNYDKLLRGNNITAEQANKMLSKLSQSDWDFVQKIWDEVNSLWPEIAALEKKMSGVEPEKVEARPFQVTDDAGNVIASVQGGYFPVVYDPSQSQAGQKQESGPLAGLLEKGYAYASTPKGHTKARSEYAAPLMLDFGYVLQRHMSGVVKDLTHREFLVDANRIINNQTIRQTLQEQLGDQYERMFMPWLRSIANDRNVSPSDGLTGLDKFIESSRTNVTTVALGYKLSTIIAQVAGAANSIEIVGTKWMSAGLMQSVRHPAESYKMVVEKSGEMRHRFDTIDRDVRDELRAMRDGKVAKWHSAVNRGAFVGVNIADRMVTIPTWIGAYNKALSEGMAEQEAIHQADAAVRRSQGAGGAKDLSAIQRKRGAIKMLTMFYTPFAAQYGRFRTVGQQTGVHGMKYAPEAIMRVLMITAIPAVLSDLLASRGPDECSVNDPSCYAKWAAMKSLFSVSSMVPVVREIGNLAEKQFNSNKPGARDLRISPVLDMFDKVGKQVMKSLDVIQGKAQADENYWFGLFETSGYMLNLPTSQARITLQYLYDLLEGSASPSSAGSFLHDIAFRRKGNQ